MIAKFNCIALLVAIVTHLSSQTEETNFHKKGIGIAEKSGINKTQLIRLNAYWYYNWGISQVRKTTVEFVPMLFSTKGISKLKKTKIILGFNEPDNQKQANLSTKEALINWSMIEKNATQIGSPALAKNLLSENNWLDEFLIAKPKIDFITVHWYKGCNPDKFVNDLIDIYNKYHLPIWVTEFAPQTVAQSKTNPNKYSFEEVAQFMKKTIQWINQQNFIQRYAWHDSKVGSSALYDNNNNLTNLGKLYAQL